MRPILFDINEQLENFVPPADESAERNPVTDASAHVLRSQTDWTEPALKQALQSIAKTAGVKGRELYEPLRRALTGREHGPPLAAVLFVQGRERVLQRLSA